MLSRELYKNFLLAAYIDPGSGYVFSSIIPLLIGIVTTILSSIIFFLKKKLFIVLVILLVIIIATISIVNKMKTSSMNTKLDKKVVILGFDGLDPKLVDDTIKKNILPNFKKLKDTGYYSLLETVVPPQSPVAWASFITAANPAKHGVYDFIERDPATYGVDLVFSNLQKKKLNSPPFWQITSKYKIPTQILFLPDTFPPEPLEGKMLSGMGVPDVLGTMGTFNLISTKEMDLDPKWRGKLIKVEDSDKIDTFIEGPKYLFLKETKIANIPLSITRDRANHKIKIVIQNQTIDLSQKQFSNWIKVEFKIDFFTKVAGIAKFYLAQVDPDLELYVSPINFDPDKPVQAISYPKDYAHQVSQKYGLYSTLGLPHDTWALEEDIFDEDAFLTQSEDILNERKKIYFGELEGFQKGLFFAYFGITDTISHMYWRFLSDPKSKYHDTILNYYQKVDSIVGETVRKLNKKDILLIVSDHGFASFDYEINMNSWLRENGYLTLTDNKEEGAELLQDVDWSKTRAYSVGYNGIYFNIKDREKEGIVDKSETDKLQTEMIVKLQTLNNPLNNQPVLKHIYTRKELGIADNDTNAPDLFLGFYASIRSSWDTAIGAAPLPIIKKRDSKWSGDHLYDPSEVPGVIMSNIKIEAKSPKFIDIIPTVLDIFKIPQQKFFQGINLL